MTNNGLLHIRVRMLVKAVLASLALGAAAAAPAQAHWNVAASGCTWNDVCVTVYANKGTTHVNSIRGYRGLRDRTCDYQAKFTAEQNGAYWTRWSALRSGCTWDAGPNRSSGLLEMNFRNPSNVCSSWYEGGRFINKACRQVYS